MIGKWPELIFFAQFESIFNKFNQFFCKIMIVGYDCGQMTTVVASSETKIKIIVILVDASRSYNCR